VILKPTDFKNDEILLTAWSPGGHSLSTDENYFSASNADVVINECGIGGFSPVDLQKILAGKTANARSYISMLEEGITANATPQDIETMFQLIYLSFTAPNRSQDLFDSFISRNKEMLKNIFSNPTYYFYNARNKVLGQNHLRSNRIFEEEEWNKINLDSAVNFYKNRFADAGDFTFVLVGNFNVEPLKPLLAQYIGSLPSSGRIETWIDHGIRYPEGRVDTSFHKGSDQKSNVSIVLHNAYKYDKNVNYLLKSFTDVLNIKLIEVLREEKSGVYGVGASFSGSKWPYENFTLSISYPCKPENIDSLNTAVFDIIKNIKNKGVSDEDIQKVKESQLKEFEVKIKENGYWLSALKYAYLHGYNPEEIATYEKNVENLNSKNIQETANKYIDFKNCIILKLLPETE
jgi:zinc protease